MNAKEELGKFKKEFDKELKIYLELKTAEAKLISPLAGELSEQIKDLTLRGGKRIRAALLYYSYIAHGGKSRSEAMKAAMSMELSETYLLIHDDIMDQDSLRRGGETIHVFYERECQSKYKNHSLPHHFGTSMAILAGNIACSLSNEVISNLSFKKSVIVRALSELNKIYTTENFGQALDIFSEIRENVSKEDILKTHELKTVPYTFDGPVKIGAILAGAREKQIQILEGYSIPLGTAFQIQDDILGMFGSEEKLGKPVTSDLKEGKKTLLILDALSRADEGGREVIGANLGNKRVTYFGLNQVRKVIISTGALEDSKKLAGELVIQAFDSLQKLRLKPEGKEFLLGIADYMINREY